MDRIDFSPKHDALIRYPDGTLLPMDEPHYMSAQIAPGTWQILSSGDFHYLLEGEDEAIAIDTGYGAGNLREYLASLCGKSVRRVINTHHHFDHTANNAYFDLVYMAEESIEHATRPFPSFYGIDFPRDYPIEIVTDGTVIPLRGRELEILKIPDHAPGSIAILDRKARLLFTGDEFMDFGKRLNGTPAGFLQNMEKIMAHRSEFDCLCGGPGIFPASLADSFFEAAKLMAAGEVTEGFTPAQPPKARPEYADGHIVYDCREPHPEDRFGGSGQPPALQPDVLLHKGLMFYYVRGEAASKEALNN